MKKRIVTLTTDWGIKDHYVASVKGKLLSLIESDILILDITHQISPLQIYEAAFVLKNCIDFYPPGTIHIIEVCSEASTRTPHLLVEHVGQFFIGADNGIFTLLFDKADRAFEIEVFQDSDFFTFPTRDVFVKVAASLINGEPPETIGVEVKKLKEGPKIFTPASTNISIIGVVVYIDNYGNIITNISYEKFRQLVKNKPFTITFGTYEIDQISDSYQDVPLGEFVAMFNTSGLLEIAQNAGNAARVLGFRFNDVVKVLVVE